ncbi:MAG: hypothetical protein U0521_10945 [Anaerolineae bacterium]
MGGGCSVPVAAHAVRQQDRLVVRGRLLAGRDAADRRDAQRRRTEPERGCRGGYGAGAGSAGTGRHKELAGAKRA